MCIIFAFYSLHDSEKNNVVKKYIVVDALLSKYSSRHTIIYIQCYMLHMVAYIILKERMNKYGKILTFGESG